MRRDSNATHRDVLHRLGLGAWESYAGMPILQGADRIPASLWPFHNARKGDVGDDVVIHFYSEDWKFEDVWRRPERYGERFRGKVLLTPDFSLFLDDPPPVQIWNVYRARLVGQIWEGMGLDVVPSLQWSDQRSWWFAFNGLPEGGVVAVSTVGIGSTKPGSKEARRQFRHGYVEMCERLMPSTVLLYGDVELDPALLELAPVRTYKPERTMEMREASKAAKAASPAQLRLLGRA